MTCCIHSSPISDRILLCIDNGSTQPFFKRIDRYKFVLKHIKILSCSRETLQMYQHRTVTIKLSEGLVPAGFHYPFLAEQVSQASLACSFLPKPYGSRSWHSWPILEAMKHEQNSSVCTAGKELKRKKSVERISTIMSKSYSLQFYKQQNHQWRSSTCWACSIPVGWGNPCRSRVRVLTGTGMGQKSGTCQL